MLMLNLSNPTTLLTTFQLSFPTGWKHLLPSFLETTKIIFLPRLTPLQLQTNEKTLPIGSKLFSKNLPSSLLHKLFWILIQ